MRHLRQALWLAVIGALLVCTGAASEDRVPVTGETVPALQPFDDMMKSFLVTHDAPGASVCIAREGRIIYARGFGYSSLDPRKKVVPRSLFRIASVSKPITAAAILRLVQTGKLKLEDRVFQGLGYGRRLRDRDVDPRLADITIEHLLHHTAGWDRDMTYHPFSQYRRISKAMNVEFPPPRRAIIEYMIGQPLQFDPGSRYAYGNFGYCVLGRVIEKVTGLTYEQYVQRKILAPLGITSMRIGRSLPEGRVNFEVRYYDVAFATGKPVWAPRRTVPRPYIHDHEVRDSATGWIGTAADLVKIAIAINTADNRLLNQQSLEMMYRPPDGPPGHEPNGNVKDSFYACGWSVRPVRNSGFNNWHNGRLIGTSTLLVRRHDDFVYAVLFNRDLSASNGEALSNQIGPLMDKAFKEVKQWP